MAAWYRFDRSVSSVEAVELAAGGSWTLPVRVSPVNAEDTDAPQVAMSPAGAAQVVWDAWNPYTHNYVTRNQPPACGRHMASLEAAELRRV